MPDEDIQPQAQNEPAATEPAAPAPPADEPQDQPAPVEEPTQEESEPTQEQTEAPREEAAEKPQPSRAERRIRQLNDKVKQATQQPYQQPGSPQQQSPRFPNYQPGQEVSPEQLQQDVVQTADAIATLRVNQQLAQRDAVSSFERDQENLPMKFEELNPDKPSYTPELDEAIAQEYQERAFRVVGYDQQGNPVTQLDPSVRLSDIASRHITAARAYAAKTNAATQSRVDASADTTAPRPSGERPAETKFENLTLEEMKARVGYHRT